ncbi:MAG: flagellar hook-basal body complex protein [Planctomycetia bacterium]|uniref:Flagellar hook protein FlgE n=1 Tax=Candidatus Brocadia sapporoensis TaxID=392547 RepID=A0A1V6LX98_9BACT|nr:flagellar hook-basal body complex protein [Candidatus Brocadia sapporoensis]MCC7238189.1 flagellar hook-basal body complex protein [Candidatus Brocadia sp.]QOJ06669.1 MAG: flagellar hook-basal body complex protein [Planctomycetia bacterium]TVL95724.1 MAG: hypothetical protein CV082_09780 [Candidatus Brocadia sp. BL1]MDG6004577.1 flagellar hook-basal body complex protein [Candidatus Brocadia sp.]OQD44764.1 hypothetical protein BIY37_12165 [Candidatus Brocadia sapporoensis]
MGLSGALYTGVSGIRAHQSMLDIIGNNLANINTYGYKSSRLLFSDMLSQTIAIGANGNPMQVGKGVKFANISSDFSTGNMEPTGRIFDLGIEGEGFFVVSGGSKNFFTRVGAFDLNSDNVLIDPSTGYKVMDSNGDEIVISKDATVSGQATSKVTVVGNLDSVTSSKKAEVLFMSTSLQESSTAATSSTELNDLDSNSTDYSDGDIILISGTKSDGNNISATFTYGSSNDGTTVGDLISVINSAFSGDATASLDPSGKIVFKADTPGSDKLSLNLADKGSNTGKTTWSDHSFNGSTYTTTATVYDSQGTPHLVSLRFTKQMDNLWDLNASMNSSDGTFVSGDNAITGISFNDDGTFSASGDTTIQFDFNGISSNQSVVFDLGISGENNGITQNRGTSGAAAKADGYAYGKYNDMSIDADGVIKILYTNGLTKTIATLKMALFNNNNGLNKVGDNLYEQSTTSGEPIYVNPNSGRAGKVRSGALEGSNVDMAVELTSLITAQRGFQLNTKVITTADEVLADIVNLKR